MSSRPWRSSACCTRRSRCASSRTSPASTGRARLGRQPLERGGVAPGRDDFGAGGAQDAHEALAEPARGARHDRDAAVEAEHPVDLGRHRRRVAAGGYRGRRDAARFRRSRRARARCRRPVARSDSASRRGRRGRRRVGLLRRQLARPAAARGARRGREELEAWAELGVEGWFEGARAVAERRRRRCAPRSAAPPAPTRPRSPR